MAKSKRSAQPKKIYDIQDAKKPGPPSGRPKTKVGTIIAMLQRPEGVTIAALAKATGWQTHSVRGAIAGTIKKKLGHPVKSEQRDHGERVYTIG